MKGTGLQLAFLVLAHDKPRQCAKLLRAVAPMGSSFVHMDLDTPIGPFLSEIPSSNSVQFVSNRCSIRWGGFDMVEATLRLLRLAMQSGHFDYFILLSASDYPIKSNQQIVSFLSQGGEHIRGQGMPHPGHSLSRLDHFFIPAKNRHHPAIRTLNFMLRALPARRWRQGVMKGMVPTSGSQWWALTRDCVRYVLDYVDTHPDFIRFFGGPSFQMRCFFRSLSRPLRLLQRCAGRRPSTSGIDLRLHTRPSCILRIWKCFGRSLTCLPVSLIFLRTPSSLTSSTTNCVQIHPLQEGNEKPSSTLCA